MSYDQCHLHGLDWRGVMTPIMRHPVALAAAFAFAACVPDVRFDPSDLGTVDASSPSVDGGSGPDLGPVDAGDPNLTTVPGPLASLTVTSVCTDLRPGESALSTSPEGHLWLAGTATVGGLPIRVLDGWGQASEQSWLTRFTRIDHLRAESATVASVIADTGLWSLRSGRRVSVDAPFMPGPGWTSCGSLGDRAFVLGGGRLFERSGSTWIEWTGLETLLGPEASLMGRDGACRTAGDTLYLRSGDLEVWALTESLATQTADLMGGQAVALREAQLLVLQNGALVHDPATGGRWELDTGAIDHLSAAGSYAWLRAGGELVRFDGSTFLSAGTLGPSAELRPFASGGVWALEDGRACAIMPSSMIRVTGITPGTTTTSTIVPVRARAFDATETVSLSLGGTEVSPIASEDGWLRFAPTVSAGWNTLRFTGQNGAIRALELRRTGTLPPPQPSWATDIQPIYVAHCSASACHVVDSPSRAPNLDTFASWVALSAAIQNRVLESGDMPPTASRDPSWGQDTVRTIAEWIAGGMRP